MLTITQTFPNLPTFDLLEQASSCREVLLESRELARTGTLDGAALEVAATRAKSTGKRVVLVWDALASDEEIESGAAFVRSIDLARIDAIRVQDAGVAEYVRQHFPDLALQLVLETGNHNLAGIQAWVKHFKPERIALSNEIPISTLAEWRKQVDCAFEVQIMGQLLLFFTPRKLLTPVEKERKQQEMLERFATNLEPGRSEGKVFPILENRHGTFMFYEKELFLLPYLEEIKAAGVDTVRIDLKAHDAQALTPLIEAYLANPETNQLDAIKELLGPKLTRGFFKSNRTDKQFVKFKNKHTFGAEERDDYAGTIIETRKKSFIAIMSKRPLKVGDQLRIINPEGVEISHTIEWLRPAAGERTETADTPGLWVLNHAPRASSGSAVFLA
jgi:putative protease